jgi:exopolysaccharide production protein ExoZ
MMDNPSLVRQDQHPKDYSFARLFEINARDRLLPMEGLRGIAVVLVFLQHYCRQFVETGHLTGGTALFADAFRSFGNRGVELFFVLSGFLIYGILIKKRPGFFDFMWRRAQRIYPAFLAAFFLACIVDLQRPRPLTAHGIAGAVYILENLTLLPGLFPITPISAVNWSLSYEWWFYSGITVLFGTLALGRLQPRIRVSIILAAGTALVLASAENVSWAPIRALSLLSGMLLAEAERAALKPPHLLVVLAALFLSFFLSISGFLTEWQTAVLLAASFFAVCHFSFFHESVLSRSLSFPWLRRFGNISYSFYLVHGFAVVAFAQIVLRVAAPSSLDGIFWLALPPAFFGALLASGLLFLAVEKPFSLQTRVPAAVSASAETLHT